jgi:uncharacterized protein (DUF1697 family)
MYLALLRGINVGGKNIIRMADLRQAFEDMGFADVRTYIQSGNVIFGADPRSSNGKLAARIERGLSRRFDYRARAIVMSGRQYRRALSHAPASWGEDPTRKHNAIFAGPAVRTSAVLRQLPPVRDGLEEVTCRPGVIFWSASIRGLSRTTMMKLASHPVYDELTVRNHRTALALLDLLEA